ncbi:uncharacterized protein BX664DRAFT_374517 [Halteromyces radiatus]|uniref:uncharacterized protein n=1 Tax=Halteromyces radiatus TaxID=101107 RepID=UPI00221EDB72|nr:uncharacterized protein BX664DRAFT_374517 [Halteromyces radiatus]KAI8086473.1 hypothetical protein BX664DRAFT_374517 [Halteromyces radiatus]
MVFSSKTFLMIATLCMMMGTQADVVPELLNGAAPTVANVKSSLAPPNDQQLYDVFFAKGYRIYQCNPEKKRLEHWYNVQTHALLYPAKGRQAPFDIEGKAIGQMFAAPLNQTLQMADPDPEHQYIAAYYYPDGSWFSTGHPPTNTIHDEDRKERGDEGVNLDDHLAEAAWTSTDGYFSHVEYAVRLHSLNGTHPAPNQCQVKGVVVNQPFTAFYMLYTGPEGMKAIQNEIHL